MSQILSANWHITDICNYKCKFCFMKSLPNHEANLDRGREILSMLKTMEISKVNFVGGEPLLHPHILEFVAIAKDLGFVVSIVTNGSILTCNKLMELKPYVDWIGISIDSAKENVEATLGRGSGGHVENSIKVCRMIRQEGIALKINTVVTKLNYKEDLRPLIEKLRPQRWKIFQMLGIQGQNDGYLAELAANEDEFRIFRQVNENAVLEFGRVPTFETNEDMVDSYLMLSPDGKVIQNSGGRYVYYPLEQVAQSGRLAALVNTSKYLARGGKYDW